MQFAMEKNSPDKPTASNGKSGSDQEQNKIADKLLTANNGEIGYFIKKGKEFIPMKNFSVLCTGYVVENATSGSSEGFLFRVLPKESLIGNETGEGTDEFR